MSESNKPTFQQWGKANAKPYDVDDPANLPSFRDWFRGNSKPFTEQDNFPGWVEQKINNQRKLSSRIYSVMAFLCTSLLVILTLLMFPGNYLMIFATGGITLVVGVIAILLIAAVKYYCYER